MADTYERIIPAPTHGRVLIARPVLSSPRRFVVGFHGYAENAPTQLARLQTLRAAPFCLLASIQGLHRFYRRSDNEVIASWMTREDRVQAIGDNNAYVARVIESLEEEWGLIPPPLVFAGFSQGVATAFRSACDLAARTARKVALVAIGGDVPPELEAGALARLHSVLIGRGERDEWYTEEKWNADADRLEDAGVSLDARTFDADHDWTPEFSAAADEFLERLPTEED